MSTFEIIFICITIMAVAQSIVEIKRSKYKQEAKASHVKLEQRVLALEEYINSLQTGVQTLKEERLAEMNERESK